MVVAVKVAAVTTEEQRLSYLPVPLLVVSVMVKSLSVASTADSAAHTCTIPSPSPMNVVSGIDTVTSTMIASHL